jgi:hypothetical protein
MKTAVLGAFMAATLIAGCTERTAAVGKLDRQSAVVGIMALQWPKVVVANSDYVVKVAIRNNAGVTLPALGADASGALRVNVSYHWETTDHRVVVWDGILTPLRSDLAPGDQQELDVKVHAPASPGQYFLELDVLQSGVFWFGGVGSQTATMLVDVR